MCSIFGFIARRDSDSPSLKALQSIVRGNIARGPHAFGFAWVDARGRLSMYKQTGRLTDDIGMLSIARDARMLVGHLRYATHGDARDNVNNHPHPADGGWVVHNGVVRNHRELVSDLGLLTVSECDSEIICRLVELADGPLARRCAWAVRETEGNLAMLGLWARPATMVVARRGNPLHTCAAGEGLYLATLPHGMPGRPEAVADNRVIRLGRRAGKIVVATSELPRPSEAQDTLPWSICDDDYRGG